MTQSSTITKTVILLNNIAEHCNKPNFDPRKFSTELKTSNDVFYKAVQLGYFTKIDKCLYVANTAKFTRTQVERILEYSNEIQNERAKEKRVLEAKVKSQIQIQLPISKPEGILLTHASNEQIINELKRRGAHGNLSFKTNIEL